MQAPPTRFGRHISASSLSTIANVLVGVWLARFLTSELGVAGYAVVAMAAALTSALAVFTSSATSAVGRFLTEALARSDDAEATRVFSSALFAVSAAGVALTPVILLASHNSPTMLAVAEDPEPVRAYVLLTLSTTVILSAVTVFNSSAFAVGRFDLLSGLQASQALLRAALMAGLVLYWERTLRSVGVGMLIASMGALAASVAVWRHLTPGLAISARAVSKTTLRTMAPMSLWVGVDTVGMLLIYGLSTLLLGRLVGAAQAASYGLYLSVVSCVGALGGALTGPVQPGIYSAWARGDRGEAARLVLSGARVSLVVLALLSAGIVGLRLDLVSIWLGEGFDRVAGALAVGVPLYAFASAISPCLAVLNARDRTSRIAVATVIAGGGHLATCLVLYSLGRVDVAAVALSAAAWVAAKMLALLCLSFDDASHALKIFLRLGAHFAILFAPALAVAVAGSELVDLSGVGLPAIARILVVGPAVALTWAGCALWALSPGDVDHLLGRAWRDTPAGRAFLSFRAEHLCSVQASAKPVGGRLRSRAGRRAWR